MRLTGRKLRQVGIFSVAVCIGLLSPSLWAGSKLVATKTSSSVIAIRLENDEAIAGLQFVLRSSSNVLLKEIRRSGRTSTGNWTVASNPVNDSTLKVLIVSTDLSSFSSGDGAIAEVTFSTNNDGPGEQTITFTDVVAANPQAALVHVSTSDLVLDGQTGSSAVSVSDVVLRPNFPNPFNPSTRLTYELRRDARVSLTIFDLAGREISRLVDQYQPKGSYSVTWNSSENRWGQLASGVYFARLQAGNIVMTQKVLLTK